MPSSVTPGSAKTDIRTPVTVLTGFLGGGKTTLLNRALRDPSMERTALVINEFGAVPIDNALAVSSDDTITVLENGCLCCTVFGSLVETLNRLYHDREAGKVPPFDRLVIETSGLADPGPVLQAFLSEPTLDGLYRLASVVAVVDAVNGPDTLKKHDESVRQVALADQILITKLDLVPIENRSVQRDELRNRITSLNPAATISDVAEVESPAALLRAVGADPLAGGASTLNWLNYDAHHHHDHDHGDHHHHHDETIATFCLVRDEASPREALDLLLTAIERNLGPQLLRVKGLVNVAGEERPAVIQGAQHLLHNLAWLDRWPSDDHRTRIVFITQDMPKAVLAEMVELLERVANRTARARQNAPQDTKNAPPDAS